MTTRYQVVAKEVARLPEVVIILNMAKARYAVISKTQAGWATVYVGPDRALADQIYAREVRAGRQAHVMVEAGAKA